MRALLRSDGGPLRRHSGWAPTVAGHRVAGPCACPAPQLLHGRALRPRGDIPLREQLPCSQRDSSPCWSLTTGPELGLRLGSWSRMTLRPVGDSHPRPVGVEEGARRCPRPLQWAERGWRRGGGLGRCSPHPGLRPPSSPAAPPLTPGAPPAQGPCCGNSAVTPRLAVSTEGLLHPPNLQAAGRPESQDAWVRECERPRSHRRGLASGGRRQWTVGPRRLSASSFLGDCALSPSRVPGLPSKKRQPVLPALGIPSGLRRRGQIDHPPASPTPTLGNQGQEGGGVSCTRGSGSGLPLPTPPVTHTHKVTWTRGGHTSGPPSVTSPSSGCGEVRSREAGKRSRPSPHSAPPWGPRLSPKLVPQPCHCGHLGRPCCASWGGGAPCHSLGP